MTLTLHALLLLSCADGSDSNDGADAADAADTAPEGSHDWVADLRINEVMAEYVQGNATLENTGDWVEVVNVGGDSALVADLYLTLLSGSGDGGWLCRQTLWNNAPPVELAPGERLLALDGRTQPEADHCRMELVLRKEGATLALFRVSADDGTTDGSAENQLDAVSWSGLFAPNSIARTPDGTGEFAMDATPTPGASNDD